MSPRSAAARVIAPWTAAARNATARTTADRATGAPAAVPAGRPDLRVVPSTPVRRLAVRPSRAHGERKAPYVLLVVAMLVATTLGLLFLNTAIAVDSLSASRLRAENAELAQEVQSLQRRVVSHDTPGALAAAATAAGLVPAGSAAYLVIAPDGSSTLRGAATPAPEPPKPSRVPADRD